jgi:hypothetical protein
MTSCCCAPFVLCPASSASPVSSSTSPGSNAKGSSSDRVTAPACAIRHACGGRGTCALCALWTLSSSSHRHRPFRARHSWFSAPEGRLSFAQPHYSPHSDVRHRYTSTGDDSEQRCRRRSTDARRETDTSTRTDYTHQMSQSGHRWRETARTEHLFTTLYPCTERRETETERGRERERERERETELHLEHRSLQHQHAANLQCDLASEGGHVLWHARPHARFMLRRWCIVVSVPAG